MNETHEVAVWARPHGNDLSSDLAKGVAHIESYIELLTEPEKLYGNSSDAMRKRLNQAIFERMCVVSDEIVWDELKELLSEMLTA